MTEKETHLCSICGENFEVYSEAISHVEEKHKETLNEQGDNAEWYVVSQMVEEEQLSQVPETEEVPEGTGYNSEDELKATEIATKIAENYDSLNDKQKSEFLKILTEITTHNIPTEVMHKLNLQKTDEQYIGRIIELVVQGSCPVCDEHWSKMMSSEQLDAYRRISDTKIPKGESPYAWCGKEQKIEITIHHIQNVHPEFLS